MRSEESVSIPVRVAQVAHWTSLFATWSALSGSIRSIITMWRGRYAPFFYEREKRAYLLSVESHRALRLPHPPDL